MILVTCPGCGKRLNVKDEYAGRKAKCPNCGTILVIPTLSTAAASPIPTPPGAPAAPPTPSVVPHSGSSDGDFSAAIDAIKKPMKLDPACIYVLFNGDKLIGLWKMASGWQVKTQSGFGPARTNVQAIPTVGSFTLVELYAPTTDAGKKLKRLSIFKLTSPDAGRKISIEPQMILSAISGYGTMTKGQKTQIFDVLKEAFMRDVWGSADKIRDFLTNFDAHSHLIEE